jgi:hypothetical protein
MSYVALATTTLGSAAATVTFSSIPATYRDLIVVVTGGASSGSRNVLISFNGDTNTSNFAAVQMSGDGSSPAGGGVPNTRILNNFGFMSADLNTVIKTEIFDYAQTNKHKTYLTRANNAGNGVAALASRWANTNAINTVAITCEASTFQVGSTFSLYGVA